VMCGASAHGAAAYSSVGRLSWSSSAMRS
jgi:hypothetical protein